MSPSELTVRLIAGGLLILSNAFFVATEFALTRVPQFEKSEFQDHPGLRRAWDMVGELEIYLTGCQLGITTTSILLGIVVEPAITVVVEPVVALFRLGSGTTTVVSVVVAVILINLIHKIWGEQAPTYLGVEAPKMIVRYAAPIHYWWTTITYPFILFGDGAAKKTLALFGVSISRSWTEAEADGEDGAHVGSRTELKRRMAALLRNRDMPYERRQEVMNALTIGEQSIRDYMVPRENAITLSVQNSLEENLDIAAEHLLNRFPLVNGSLDEVVGTIYAATLLRDWDDLREGTVTLERLAAAPIRVSADASVSDLIDHLQEHEQEMAFVEENGTTVGLITITDAFEAITGEVRDPLDRFYPQNEPGKRAETQE